MWSQWTSNCIYIETAYKKGLGTEQKQVELITPKDEATLGEGPTSYLDSTVAGLLYTVYFYNCKCLNFITMTGINPSVHVLQLSHKQNTLRGSTPIDL